MFDHTFQFPEPLEIRPPEYPLDREAFDRALTTGHGRTLVHALRFGVEPFKDLILDAAIHCRYSDPIWESYPPPSCPVSHYTDVHGWSLAKLCIMAEVADEVLNAPIDGEGSCYRWNSYQWERIEEEPDTCHRRPSGMKSTADGGNAGKNASHPMARRECWLSPRHSV